MLDEETLPMPRDLTRRDTERVGPLGRDALLFWNTRSGTASRVTSTDVLARLGDHGVRATLHELAPSDDLEAAVRAVLLARADAGQTEGALVIAAGGDGTVSTVAAAIAGTEHALGILPLGTSNSIARALSLPVAPLEAIDAMLAHEDAIIDMARVAGRAMVLTATTGVHASTVGFASPEDKRALGALAYVQKGFEVLADHEPFTASIEIDGTHVLETQASAITVANVAPVRTWVAQGPSELVADDGLLDVTVVAVEGLLETLATGLELVRSTLEGRGAERDNVGYFRARTVRIHTEPPQAVLVDGELVGLGSFAVEVVPRALRVAGAGRTTGETEPVDAHDLLRARV